MENSLFIKGDAGTKRFFQQLANFMAQIGNFSSFFIPISVLSSCRLSVCNLIQQFFYKNGKNFGWKLELSDAIVSSKL